MTNEFNWKMGAGTFANGDAQLVAQIGGMAGACPVATIKDGVFCAVDLANEIARRWNALASAGQLAGEGEVVAPREVNASYDKLFRQLFTACCLHGAGIDGGDLQELLEEAGVIVATQQDKPCGDECNCADIADFPTTCYRLAAPQPSKENSDDE